MGKQRPINPPRLFLPLAFAILSRVCQGSAQVQANSQPLVLPGAITYDTAGDLYVAETGNHVIRKLTPAGTLTIVAGTGTQGFAGDAAAATAAVLDSPAGIAVDAVGDLYIADTHNQRVRRVDAVTGVISTVAGTGSTGFGGDGGKATAALLNLPGALALDTAGDLYIADTRNHRIRRVDAVTGVISTVAGTGVQGLGGDGGAATSALLDSPAGLAVDASADLYIADSHNQRVRRVDAVTGAMTTFATSGLSLPRGVAIDSAGNLYIAVVKSQQILRVANGANTAVAGEGTELFAGDGAAATAASLDSPGAVALSPAGLATLADTADGRVRQVDATGVISTIAGVGAVVPTSGATLTLTGPASAVYGTGAETASLSVSGATGSVAFYDTFGGVVSALGSVNLSRSTAAIGTGGLAAGAHSISATYTGDATHLAAQAPAIALTLTPAPVTATPAPLATLYGQAVPAPAGTITGVLAQDSGKISAIFASSASSTSPPGAYPILATLSGAAAGNYRLTTAPASVTIGQAPSLVTLGGLTGAAPLGSAIGATVHVASTTSGVPTGAVTVLDGASAIASATLNANGDAALTLSTLSLGSHTLSSVYAGDANFLASTSSASVEVIQPAASPDFSIAASGTTSQTVPAGTVASFSFALSPIVSQGVSLASPVELSIGGLPNGATASFNPAYVPPGSGAVTVTLSIQTPQAALTHAPGALAFAVCLFTIGCRRRRRLASLLVLLAVIGLTAGCGARVNTATAGATPVSYSMVITGTATAPDGTVLVHSVPVTLVVE